MSNETVEEYVDQFDSEVKARLKTIRQVVREIAPSAEEAIMYGIIGYKSSGKPLVYIGGFKNHVGFYATPNGHVAFKDEFAQYKQGKGSVQFPNDQPLPLDLIKRVIKYRLDQVS